MAKNRFQFCIFGIVLFSVENRSSMPVKNQPLKTCQLHADGGAIFQNYIKVENIDGCHTEYVLLKSTYHLEPKVDDRLNFTR